MILTIPVMMIIILMMIVTADGDENDEDYKDTND